MQKRGGYVLRHMIKPSDDVLSVPIDVTRTFIASQSMAMQGRKHAVGGMTDAWHTMPGMILTC